MIFVDCLATMSGSMWLIPFLILGNTISSTSESIRLVNGKNSCSGRVEVFFYGQWGTVCDNGWDLSDAAVVCREMGCGDAVEAKSAAYFGPGWGQVFISDVTCFGTEPTLSICGSKKVGEFNCDHTKDAGVTCQSLVRLVNGSHSCSGRVEVLHEGQWGTVCDDGWDLSDASVVCKEMGCGEVFERRSGGYFGQGSGPVWLSDVQCDNTESTLRHCTLKEWGQNSCGHEKDAGVACRRKIKFESGINACSGRVEIFYYQWGNVQWGTVSDNGWDLSDAAVVCREMGCGDAVEAKNASYFGPSWEPVWLEDVNCIGNEATLGACEFKKLGVYNSHSNNAGVICQALIKLVNGTNTCSGRVEVFYDGRWGTVCDDGWDSTRAAVVCKELGCGDVIEAKSAAYFGPGSGPVWLSGLQCATDSTLRNCNSQGWGQNSCGHEKDAGVACRPKIRLANGSTSCSGRVEVFYNGQWGTVCDDGWDLSDAAVACREMGCGDAVEAKSAAYFGPGAGKIFMGSVNCVGNEATLSVCESRKFGMYDHSKDAGVICDSPVRLINGGNSCSGRVEVHYNGIWGTVCDIGWDLSDAAVVCREMGCGDAVETKNAAYFGQGSGPAWLSDLQCSNTESSLRDCKSSGWGKGGCGHEKDAGVICQDKVRLVNSTSSCSGRVEVLQNRQWGTVCDDGWDASDAAVVCRQLGCGAVLEVKSAAYYGKGSGTVWMSNVNCFGNESTLMNCSYNRSPTSCGHEKDAGVICGYIKVLLRIEVKAELGVNPNGAEIMNKLSEEMGKKLQINGTFSLRTQADGNVFHKRKGIAP
ncbi:deleted in malignant brain tumors 1 protein [Megalobrama amblycephala]|uniref:deleted in malignant brain tumors 1 protein n=1 Tax=Megalobrama amblycephala TaxID=75352 RepID=UPI002013E924|nr:deleted in malignant brain tumors 1 protein [Megalobrama amblycephala]